MKDKNEIDLNKLIDFLKTDFVTKKESSDNQKHIDKRFDEILNILDKQTVILNRIDIERISTLQFGRRLSREVGSHDKDIKLLKAKVNI